MNLSPTASLATILFLVSNRAHQLSKQTSREQILEHRRSHEEVHSASVLIYYYFASRVLDVPLSRAMEDVRGSQGSSSLIVSWFIRPVSDDRSSLSMAALKSFVRRCPFRPNERTPDTFSSGNFDVDYYLLSFPVVWLPLR